MLTSTWGHLGAPGSIWEHLGDGEVMDHTALLTEYKNLMTGAYFQLCWLRFLATLISLRKSMQSSIHELDK